MCVQYINQYQPDSSKVNIYIYIYLFIHISLSSSMFLSNFSAQVTSFNRPIWSMFLNPMHPGPPPEKVFGHQKYRCLGNIVTIKRKRHLEWVTRYGPFQGLFVRDDLGTMIVFVEVSLGDGFFCFFTNLYGLSQQEILKNRSVKPQELES